MTWKFQQIYAALSKRSNYKLLKNSKHGLERECLRVNQKATISQLPHPQALGAAITHPYITTDFSESQLELVTPTFNTERKAADFLRDIHCFIEHTLPKEYLWPMSMPCHLPNEKKIPIGQYGKSDTGKGKTQYRIGLSHRYGKKMQTVSGTHYNFSFSEDFWKFVHNQFAPDTDLQEFISDSYFHIIRNFLRLSWINTYLFGASPAIDKSYCKRHRKELSRKYWSSYYGPYSTSLRLSKIGYYSKVQDQNAVSFNNLEEYLADIQYCINTKSPKYKGMPGLNENILQIENEHYSRIRPKRVLNPGERPSEALKQRGVQYIEVRALDLNPYSEIGINCSQLRFLHPFLIYCLFQPSPPLTGREQKEIFTNQNLVAMQGRKPELKIKLHGKSVDLRKTGKRILKEMRQISKLLDAVHNTKSYTSSLDYQLEKFDDPSKTTSARIIQDMKDRRMSHAQFGYALAKEHKEILAVCKKGKKKHQFFKDLAEQSLIDQENLEIKEATLLKGYEDLEVSTQILMKEAMRQGIKVEVLDRNSNFIRLTKGRHSKTVRQATKTDLDSYLAYEIMDNKTVSKIILEENDIVVPKGTTFSSKEAALSYQEECKKIDLIVKPNDTNYGIGVNFVEAGDAKGFEAAVNEAFSHSKEVIVEEFVSGNEYRFLVIENKLISVIQRIPANVVGDGKSTISQLIDAKNEDPRNYKFFNDYFIRKGKAEKDFLKGQRLKLSSVPKKGQQIFLRANSNVSTGGDPLEVIEQIPEEFKAIAIKAAKTVDAIFCGVDLIIRNKPGKNQAKYAIIEINYNPALQMHSYPINTEPNPKIARIVLKTLGF